MEGRTILNGVLIGAIALVLLWAFVTPPGDWGDASSQDVPRDPDYWFIHLVGTESRELIEGNESEPRSCDAPAGFEVQAETQELVVPSEHDQDRVEQGGQALLLDLKEQRSSCPIAYGLATQSLLERQLGHYGWFYYEIADNGTVFLGNGTILQPGETLPVTYTAEVDEEGGRYRIEGRFDLIHHGSWQKDDVRLKQWD